MNNNEKQQTQSTTSQRHVLGKLSSRLTALKNDLPPVVKQRNRSMSSDRPDVNLFADGLTESNNIVFPSQDGLSSLTEHTRDLLNTSSKF